MPISIKADAKVQKISDKGVNLSFFSYFCTMKYFIPTLAIALSVVSFSSCKEENAEAKQLLESIRQDYESGNYDEALLTIDSLRHAYPTAINERKEALKIHQEASLKKAQANLAVTDSALQAAEREYKSIWPTVEKRHKEGTATEEELSRMNQLRKVRDSLQVVFNVECAKIKYIHKRQKQMPQEEK